MITKLEVLNTIAVRYGYRDWIHIGFFKEPIELTPMIEEAMELYTELSNSHKQVVMQAEGSDGAQGAAVGQRSVGTNAAGGNCDNFYHNFDVEDFGECTECKSKDVRKSSEGHL